MYYDVVCTVWCVVYGMRVCGTVYYDMALFMFGTGGSGMYRMVYV